MYRQLFLRLFLGLWVLMLQATVSVVAQEAMALQVSGAHDTIASSVKDLDAMRQVTFETTTIWTDHLTMFSGVPLKTVLDAGSVDGHFVKMVALNDYAVTIPITDIDEDTPIIATRMNSDLMPIRTKGRFWIVFPYDSDPKYRTETHYARSIWQLNRLIVTEG